MKLTIHKSDDHGGHRFDANTGRGFVCILDLRPARSGKSGLTGRFFACMVLLSLVILFASMRVPTRPAPPLLFNAASMNLTAWESPTGFLLTNDFPPTPPN